jgi:guanosine-diphosphatase
MVSPRSANYGKLEDGMGPSRIGKHFGWKKFAIGAGVLIGLVWAFGPRYSALSLEEQQGARDVVCVALLRLSLTVC